MAGDARSALILRVWLEDGPTSFRARLTALDTHAEGTPHSVTIAVASSPAEVINAVAEWLDGFLHDGADMDDGLGNT
jgi:hypothetical protein